MADHSRGPHSFCLPGHRRCRTHSTPLGISPPSNLPTKGSPMTNPNPGQRKISLESVRYYYNLGWSDTQVAALYEMHPDPVYRARRYLGLRKGCGRQKGHLFWDEE